MNRRYFVMGAGALTAGLFLPGDIPHTLDKKQVIIDSTASRDGKPTDHKEQPSRLERLLEVTYPEDIHQFTIPTPKDSHLNEVIDIFRKQVYAHYDNVIGLYRQGKLVSRNQIEPMQQAFLDAINKSVNDAVKASPYLLQFFNANYQRLEQNSFMVLSEYFKEHGIQFNMKESTLRSGFSMAELSLVRVDKEVHNIRIASRDFGTVTTTMRVSHQELKGIHDYETGTTAHALDDSFDIDISALQHDLRLLYRIVSGSVQPQTADEEISIQALKKDLGVFYKQAHSEQEFVALALPQYVRSYIYHEAGHIIYQAYLNKNDLSKKDSKNRDERDQHHQLHEIVGLYLQVGEGNLPYIALIQIGSVHIRFPYDYAGEKLFATMPQILGLPSVRTGQPLTNDEKVEILHQLSHLPREEVINGLRQVYEQCLPELKAGRKI